MPRHGDGSARKRAAHQEGARLYAVAHRGVVAGTQLGERTPSTSTNDVPAPLTRAPMATSMLARSTISGSHAAFSSTVRPSAATAA